MSSQQQAYSMTTLFSFIILQAALLVSVSAEAETTTPFDDFRVLQDNNNNTYPTCGDCFCVPDNDGVPDSSKPCPTELLPETNFTSLIPILRDFTWNNPMTLECDPYNTTETCDTTPPLVGGGACVVNIIPNNTTTCPTEWSYSTRTYDGTYQQALNEGLHVTHASACGTCSSLQDLASYMETGPSLQSFSKACGFRGQVNKTDGIQCFLDLGFTLGCAQIWYYNTVQSAKSCLQVCTRYTIARDPSNGPPPNCTLADCLYCDEVNSGPIFKEYAGRSRRNSGLLSGIVRNCSEMIPLVQENPCDYYENMTTSATSSSASMYAFLSVSFVVTVLMSGGLVG